MYDIEVKRILKQSEKEMFLLHHPYVGTEHMILAILKSNSFVSEILNKYSLTYKGFKTSLVKIVGRAEKKSEIALYTPLLKKTLIYASVYPCLSDIVFHVGSIALYLYCLCYFLDIQTAVFTLFMSYWGVIKVPSQGFSETSINFFSNLYSKKLTSHYDNIKYKINQIKKESLI